MVFGTTLCHDSTRGEVHPHVGGPEAVVLEHGRLRRGDAELPECHTRSGLGMDSRAGLNSTDTFDHI